VLEAAGATESFEFTLAFMFGDEHAATVMPLPSNIPFDPTIDAVIVAVPADCVLTNFTVLVNPLLQQHLLLYTVPCNSIILLFLWSLNCNKIKSYNTMHASRLALLAYNYASAVDYMEFEGMMNVIL